VVTDSFSALSQNFENQLLASSCLSVRLSAQSNSVSIWRICMKFDIRKFFEI
jgi:hypothetical protein